MARKGGTWKNKLGDSSEICPEFQSKLTYYSGREEGPVVKIEHRLEKPGTLVS
jgi:hypothetical protein